MYIETKNAPAAIGAYSQGVLKGDTLYVSGQLPIDPKNGETKTDIAEATEQCLKNVLAIVEAAGLKKQDIVRCGIFMKDLGQFQSMNERYGEFFHDHKPARAAIEAARLPKDVVIEIDAIAVKA